MIIIRLSVLLWMAIAGHSASAVELTPVWCTAVAAGTSECFASPGAACARQHEVYAPENPGLTYVRKSVSLAHCDWLTHAEGPYPINPLPTSVSLRCRKPDGSFASSVGLAVVPPGICVPENEITFSRTACTYNPTAPASNDLGVPGTGIANPMIGNPVLIRDGSKYLQVEDFATADGRMKVVRTYRSLIGASSAYSMARQSGIGWRFGQEWTIQIHEYFEHNGSLTVMAPDGATYNYTFPSSGGVVSQTNRDITLSFVNTSGSSVTRDSLLAAGGTFKILTATGTEIELALFQPAGSGSYWSGRPTTITQLGGYRQELSYGADRQLIAIEDSFGRRIDVVWHMRRPSDGTSNLRPVTISRMRLPDGTELRYHYESLEGSRASDAMLERLYRVELLDATGVVRWYEQFHYEDARLSTALTGVTDAKGIRYAKWQYDSMGRVVSMTHPDGADATQIAYSNSADHRSAIRTVTNALGKRTVYTFTRDSLYSASDYKLR